MLPAANHWQRHKNTKPIIRQMTGPTWEKPTKMTRTNLTSNLGKYTLKNCMKTAFSLPDLSIRYIRL